MLKKHSFEKHKHMPACQSVRSGVFSSAAGRLVWRHQVARSSCPVPSSQYEIRAITIEWCDTSADCVPNLAILDSFFVEASYNVKHAKKGRGLWKIPEYQIFQLFHFFSWQHQPTEWEENIGEFSKQFSRPFRCRSSPTDKKKIDAYSSESSSSFLLRFWSFRCVHNQTQSLQPLLLLRLAIITSGRLHFYAKASQKKSRVSERARGQRIFYWSRCVFPIDKLFVYPNSKSSVRRNLHARRLRIISYWFRLDAFVMIYLTFGFQQKVVYLWRHVQSLFTYIGESHY
jgi:hypothetical protein